MTLHLIKLAVGIDSLDELFEYRRKRYASEGGSGPYRITTRHMPKREAEVLDGGSLYWVIRGLVRVRQRVLGLVWGTDSEGRRCCVFELDHLLVPTEPQAHRPFQGWRYLAPEDAPADRTGASAGDELPAKLVRELRALGLM